MPALVAPPAAPLFNPEESLLTETLADHGLGQDYSPELGNDRDYTDDLEDLVSMSVAQQLHSRRSHSTMQTFLPSSPPLTANLPPPRFASPPPTSLPLASPSSSSDGGKAPLSRAQSTGARGGKRRPSAIPRPGGAGPSGGAGGNTSRTPSPELGRRKGSLPLSHEALLANGSVNGEGSGQPEGSAGEAGEEEEKWETLQVGTPITTPSFSTAPTGSPAQSKQLQPGTKRRAPSASPPNRSKGTDPSSAAASKAPAGTAGKKSVSPAMARAKTVDFPPSSNSASAPSSLGSSSSPASKPRPSAGSTVRASPFSSVNTNGSTPRKRAQTARLADGSSPSSSPSSRNPRPSVTARTPKPSTITRPPCQPRRKSLSTAQELAELRLRVGGVDPVTGLPLVDARGRPSWETDPAPLVYRTSKGDLAFGSPEREGGRTLRPEDRVLPAVARRLEAERLAALSRETGETGGERAGGEGEGELLVNEWGRDGTPRSAVSWNGRGKRPNAAGFGVEGEVGAGEGEESARTSASMGGTETTPQSLEPALTPPPSAALSGLGASSTVEQSYPSPLPPHSATNGSIQPSSSDPSAIVPSPAPSHTQYQQQQPPPSSPLAQNGEKPSSSPTVEAAAGEKGGKKVTKKKKASAQEDDRGAGCCRCVIC
ncbi:hypothetical protein JCM8547_005130 [Rhodosporidiobolus lusitaniae]